MKKLITESDVRKLIAKGSNVVVIGKDDILTPLAKDLINSERLQLITHEEKVKQDLDLSIDSDIELRKVAVGCDHTGFKLKHFVIKILSSKGYELIDVGTYDEKSCDYPDFAEKVAQHVKEKKVDFGIMIDATGIPSAIAANKVKEIRAATLYNSFTAKSAREHNNANLIVIGAKALGEETAREIIESFLSSSFLGDKHQRRLDKITLIERKN